MAGAGREWGLNAKRQCRSNVWPAFDANHSTSATLGFSLSWPDQDGVSVCKTIRPPVPGKAFFNLQKIIFHPTQNLELGFTRSSIWAGVGHPFTLEALRRNFSSFGDSGLKATDPNDPGDRKSGFDFSYRIPGLRNWLSLYSDFYSDDDRYPLASPRRSAINAGLYLSHFPGIFRLDLRVESASTQLMGAVDLAAHSSTTASNITTRTPIKDCCSEMPQGATGAAIRVGARIIYPPRQASS